MSFSKSSTKTIIALLLATLLVFTAFAAKPIAANAADQEVTVYVEGEAKDQIDTVVFTDADDKEIVVSASDFTDDIAILDADKLPAGEYTVKATLMTSTGYTTTLSATTLTVEEGQAAQLTVTIVPESTEAEAEATPAPEAVVAESTTPGEVPAKLEKLGEYPADAYVANYVIVPELEIKARNSADSVTIGTATKDQILLSVEKSEGWARVSYNNRFGFVELKGINQADLALPINAIITLKDENYVTPVREEGNKDAEEVGRLRHGARVEIVELGQTYVKVSAGDVEGYVQTKVLFHNIKKLKVASAPAAVEDDTVAAEDDTAADDTAAE